MGDRRETAEPIAISKRPVAREEMSLEEALRLPTVPVPDAGRIFFGLARNAAYAAAREGDIPTIRVGGKIRALVKPIAESVGMSVKF